MARNAKEAGRSRLDLSLLSPALSHRAGLLEIIRKQLRNSPVLDKHYHAWTKETVDKVAEKRATEIFTFLDAVRSARQDVLDNEEKTPFTWKIKEETEFMRVMYRPGPEGAPYHTYCVEGIVNGPMVNAVCVSWEAPSFQNWWPMFNVPTFKIVESRWVKRIRVGDDLSQIRVKVPWPLAPREVLMTQFELEYFEDDIVIVILGTAPSDPDEAEEEIYGFSADELPPMTQDVVRMEVAGGFILQKITEEQSFFRTLVNMDIKLEFVPPWVINFITRQIVGSGYKLYQKAVLSASRPVGSGNVFQQLIATEPLYKRIKAGIQSKQKSTEVNDSEVRQETVVADTKRAVVPVLAAATKSDGPAEDAPGASSSKELVEKFQAVMNGSQAPVIRIDYEVERALEVLDKMIELVNDWKTSQAVSDTSTRVDRASDGDLTAGGSSSSVPVPVADSETRHMNGSTGCFGSGRRQLARKQNWPKLTLLKNILFGVSRRKEEGGNFYR